MAILTSQKPKDKELFEGGQVSLPFVGKDFTTFFLQAGSLDISYFLERQEFGKTKYLVPFPNQPSGVSVTRIYDENIRYTFDTDFAYREISRPRQVRVVLNGQTGSADRLGINHLGEINYVSGAQHLKEFEQFLDEYHLDAANVQSPVTFNLVSLDNDVDYTARPYLVLRCVDENIHGRCVVEDFSYKRSVDRNRIDSYEWQLALLVYDGVGATDPTQFKFMEYLEGSQNAINAATGLVDALGTTWESGLSQIANGVNDVLGAVTDLFAAVDNIDNQFLSGVGSVISIADGVLDVLERFSNTWTGWGDEFVDFFTGDTTSSFINNFNRRYSQRAILQHYSEIHKKNPRLVGAWYNEAYGENGNYNGLRQSFEIPLYYVQLYPERYEYVYPNGDETQPPVGARRIFPLQVGDVVLEQQQQALTSPDDAPTFWYDVIEMMYQLEILLGYIGGANNRRADIGPNALTGFLLRETGLRALATRNNYGDITPREQDAPKSLTVNHTMRAGESLMTVASGYFGDPDLWPILARLNGCHDAHTFNDGRNLGVGTIIRLPIDSVSIPTSLNTNSGYDPEDEVFFMDFEIGEDGDLVFDLNAPNDLSILRGVDNVKQAIATRLNTVAGEITRHPRTGIGTQGLVGAVITEAQATLVLTRLREALMEDPRIVDVVDSRVTRGDKLNSALQIEFTVITLGDRSFRLQTEV
jgi:phage baseplate assembly protein W